MTVRRGHLPERVVLGALYLLWCTTTGAAAPQPAFPGAEGFGADTPGGRGGRIIEVTNLSSTGPGSLREACAAKGPRIVVFRVSGIIEGSVSVREPFVTIAGQTAPGDGICIRNGVFHVGTHDVVVRHLRVRPGDHPFGPCASDRDCISVSGPGDRVHDVIIDHCSVSWGIDENMGTWGGPRNVTFQWCITSESLLDSLHPKGPHGMGFILGSSENTVSVHHCLFAHNSDRNPYINMKSSKTPTTIDLRNNVIYTFSRTPCSTGGGNLRLNYVGNYLATASSTRTIPRAFWVFPYGHDPKFYVDGNVWPGMPEGESDGWGAVWDFAGDRRRPAPHAMRLRKLVPTPHVTTQPAHEAYESVLRLAGCTRPVRDVVDARIVAEVRARAGAVIDSQEDVGGWPEYAGAAPPQDSDHDAMPDAWETRFGFAPNDSADASRDRDGDGYTNVEEFLNESDPTRPDTGAPIPPRPVRVQTGNDRIRGEAARDFGRQRLAKATVLSATQESVDALVRRVRESDKEVATLLGIKFVEITPGALTMGKATMTLTKPYELGMYEVTQGQWEAVMGTQPWSGQIGAEGDPNHPATHVSCLDCQEFIRRLNACPAATGPGQTDGGREYRLPTRCEWIYAARAGTESPYGLGNDQYRVPEYGWCGFRDRRMAKTLRRSPQAVGRLKANPWGLHDLAGNALEWVHDWSHSSYYQTSRTDPRGPTTGVVRSLCGGHFRWRAWHVMRYVTTKHRSHYRGVGVGFRLCRSAEAER